ncbi:hypothetical protein [Aeromonas dhakensis]|uniref:hypothetical protein n=1 Tax=Aeromonas dhakensis TaxID=196024 RepID=UPI0005A8B175|nr:hypothetical protein [Aeromonas dhakensis]
MKITDLDALVGYLDERHEPVYVSHRETLAELCRKAKHPAEIEIPDHLPATTRGTLRRLLPLLVDAAKFAEASARARARRAKARRV